LQRDFHFFVAGQAAGFRCASLAGGLSLRQRKIVDAVDRHQTCRQMSDS
jgi:hypothetical protein